MLRHETSRILAQCLDGSSRGVVLLDFPAHRNFGDALIWEGTMRYLRDLGCRVIYRAGSRSFEDERMRRIPASAPILMHGGGNLGDLYPRHERFRRHIITTYPDRRMVLLPQSIHFTDREPLHESSRTYRGAPNLTMLLREGQSMDIAADCYAGVDVRFCYDLALGCPAEEHVARAATAPLVLARRDAESRTGDASPVAQSTDWAGSPPNDRLWRALSRARDIYMRSPEPLRRLAFRPHQQSFAVMSNLNVRAAVRQVGGAPWLATNRLHGHLLAVLLGVPHVVTDNSYGKTSAIYDAYSGAFTTAHWADSLEEAVDVGGRLLVDDPA
jgi:pyruvyl transferase EpsO